MGLLALMLLTDARRPGRTEDDGSLVPLLLQDRTRWDRTLIGEGVTLITRALEQHRIGEYQLQAAIAAVHDQALLPTDTDWPAIETLYARLEHMTGNPMVTLNRSVAVSMVDGPEPGCGCSTALPIGSATITAITQSGRTSLPRQDKPIKRSANSNLLH